VNWIRIAVGMKNDASVSRIADACKVRVAEAVGCVVNVLAELPAHARDGNLANTPDRLIEQWAVWEGKRGAFASAFREHLTDENCVVRAWEKHNGAAIREADTKREEARKWREKKAAEKAKERENVGPTDAPPNALRRSVDGTGRDGTVLLNNTELQASLLPTDPIGTPRDRVAQKKPKPVKADGPQFPHFSRDLCTEMHTLWVSKFGAIGYPLFRKEFGPLFTLAEADRPAGAPSDHELRDALKSYTDLVTMGDGATFASVKRAAGCLSAIANVRREYANEPERRLECVMRIIHGRTKAAA
jgi:hypothetical protein